MKPTLSVIIPVLNEGSALRVLAGNLAALRSRGVQVIVVDGGSSDDTKLAAQACADIVMDAPRGRASQMNAGAERATADVVLFLHADTALPADADLHVVEALENSTRVWGRFDVRIVPPSLWLRLVAWSMNKRSRLTGIATGDQAIFVRRQAFASVGGYQEIPLMEDVALSRQLKRLGPPLCLSETVSTSARRWVAHGIWRTIGLMWYLRLAYFLGADPVVLAKRYRNAREID